MIVFAHRATRLEPPISQPGAARPNRTLRAIRRDKRADPPAKKRAADGDALRGFEGDTLRAHRDCALLAIGTAGALRRSKLVAITTGRVGEDARRLLNGIPASKTDKEGRGHTIMFSDGRRCEPICHYRAWLKAAGITAGYPPEAFLRHSLRAGILTEAVATTPTFSRCANTAAAPQWESLQSTSATTSVFRKKAGEGTL